MNSFNRRILLVALGTTPHLMTMTLSALYKTYPDEMPTEIHVVTTKRGAECARETYLDPQGGLLADFYRDYQLTPATFDEHHIHTIPGDDGAPLEDIRTQADGSRAADFIVSLIRNFCADPKASLHVSIVGGRKSMGLLLGSAMTFYGRDQDKLSHVLSPMEYAPGQFSYPTPEDLEAKPDIVSLGEIPFLRLRPVLPQVLLSEQYSFGDIVEASQTQISQPPHARVVNHKNKYTLHCDGIRIKCEQRAVGLYTWLLLRQKLGRITHISFGAMDYETFFFLRLQFLQVLEPLLNESSWQKAPETYLGIPHDRLLQIRRRLMNQGIQDPHEYFLAFQALLTEDEKKALSQTAGDFARKLSTLRTKINDKITDHLQVAIPDVTKRRWHQYFIESNEQKDDCVYQLRLMPNHIDLPDDLLALLQKADKSAAGYWRHV